MNVGWSVLQKHLPVQQSARHCARYQGLRKKLISISYLLTYCILSVLFKLFFTFDFFLIFIASTLIYSIITSCLSHCNNQLVSKMFFGIYINANLIIVLRNVMVQWKRYELHNQQIWVCILAPLFTNIVTLGKVLLLLS